MLPSIMQGHADEGCRRGLLVRTVMSSRSFTSIVMAHNLWGCSPLAAVVHLYSCYETAFDVTMAFTSAFLVHLFHVSAILLYLTYLPPRFAQITPARHRGAMGSLPQLLTCLGILAALVTAAYMTGGTEG